MSETRKRPIRACTAKTPSRLAPLAPVVERSGTQKKKSVSNQEPSPLVFNPVPVSEEERAELRSKWELASVVNFINTFRPILNIKPFTSEELETAILTCNELLADVHITLLKGIYPPSRVALRLENWVTVLQKKLKDRWTKVAEPPFPLLSAPGTETAMYRDLNATMRLSILKALCEVRLDQEDVRGYMDQSEKKGNSSAFRKERSGATLIGNLYWCESDPISGYRLYRETLPSKSKEYKGRDASPPPASRWETLATNLEEFKAATETLLSSKFKQEVGLGRRLQQDIIPVLEDIQKRKKRAVRRLQRETNLLEISPQENGGSSGRARRDRKPVNYTFADYDRSINEAIKFTRKPPELANGHGGPTNGHYETARDQHQQRQRVKEQSSMLDEQAHDEGSSENPVRGSRSGLPSYLKFFRRRKRSQRYTERDYVESAYTEEDEDLYSDDEIEGEAIYDEEFLRKRKRRRNGYTSPADAEYKSDEQEAEEPELEEDEEGLRTSYSEEEEAEEQDDEPERVMYLSRSGRRTRKIVVPPVEHSGLRRSKRSTRSKVNYKAYEDSEEEQENEEEAEGEKEEEEDEEEEEKYGYSKQMANGGRGTNTRNIDDVDDVDYGMEMESGSLPSENSDRQEEVGNQEEEEEETQNEWSQRNGEGGDDAEELGKKQLRFLGLDLNQCAPADEWLANSRGMTGSYLDEDVSAPG